MALNTGRFVPVRFLALTAHFVILVNMLWSMDAVVTDCSQNPQNNLNEEKDRLTIGFSVGIALISIEMIGFLYGISMFTTSIALISTFAHVTAAILLSIFVLDAWECQGYWYIFGFCSGFPAFIEIVAIVIYGLGKRR